MNGQRDYRFLWLVACALLSIVLFAALDQRFQASPRFGRDAKHADRISTAGSAVVYFMIAVASLGMIRTRRASRRRTLVVFLMIALFAYVALAAGIATLDTYFGFSERFDPPASPLCLALAAINMGAAIYAVRFTVKSSRT